jgi:hypothetical protein
MLSSISLIETREPETDGGTPPPFFLGKFYGRDVRYFTFLRLASPKIVRCGQKFSACQQQEVEELINLSTM